MCMRVRVRVRVRVWFRVRMYDLPARVRALGGGKIVFFCDTVRVRLPY